MLQELFSLPNIDNDKKNILPTPFLMSIINAWHESARLLCFIFIGGTHLRSHLYETSRFNSW